MLQSTNFIGGGKSYTSPELESVDIAVEVGFQGSVIPNKGGTNDAGLYPEEEDYGSF